MGADLLLAAGIGAAAGWFAGLFGIGGGMLMGPLLLLLFESRGIAPADAALMSIATSMAGIIFTTAAGTVTHHAHRSIVWRSVRWLAPAGMAGAMVSVGVASAIPGGVIILVMAVYMAFSAIRVVRTRPVERDAAGVRPVGRPALLGIGFCGGLSGPITGQGGGLFITATLSHMGQPLILLIGTNTAVVLFISTFAVASFIAFNGAGVISYADVLAMAPACVVFAHLGARLANRLPLSWLRWAFSGLLMVIALRLLVVAAGEYLG